MTVLLHKPTPGELVTEGVNTYRRLTGLMVHAKVSGIMPRAAWYCGGDSSTTNNPFRAPGSTPLYLCLPPICGSVGGDCYLPITHDTPMEKTKQKSIKSRDTMVQKYLPSFAQHGVSQSEIPPQGAGTPSKPRDIEELT